MSSLDADQQQARLRPHERRAIVHSTIFRVVSVPLVALVGLTNTAIIVRQTGAELFGLVSLVTTLAMYLSFADTGIGAAVMTACSRTSRLADDPTAVATVQRGMQVLKLVAAVLIVVSVAIMMTDSWGVLLGRTTGQADRVAITIAVCLIALAIPAGIGIPILIGLNMSPAVVLVALAGAVVTLLITLTFKTAGITGIWYVISGTAGALIGNCIATGLALRASGLGWTALARPSAEYSGSRLLQGSQWMFVMGVALPIGLQSHRLILSHVSTAEELSRYALMVQIYAVGLTVFGTAGKALWPVFVKRRSDARASTRLWLRMAAAFGALSALTGIGIVAVGPWATSVLSGGEVVATRSLSFAFAALLMIMCIHYPAGMMLTTPTELRWQACCVIAMSVTAVVLGVWWGGMWGGTGVVAATAIAIVATQLTPDFLWIPRLLRRRTPDLTTKGGDTGAEH